mmetsp:Transcript_43448/g.84891  ORF Transcript_43448/g.84891 Transcript_43448/m.84891 type:complete len:317 (+) Transcript_43448:103-1053(+)
MSKPGDTSYVTFHGEDDGVGSSRRFTSKIADFNPFKGDGGVPAFDNSESVISAQKEIRLGFIRKVYGILSGQLLATVIVCAIALKATSATPVGSWTVLSLGSFLAGSPGFSIFVFVFSVVLLISLMCLKHTYPLNMHLLALWTLALAFTVATSCAMAVCDPMVTSGGGPPMPYSLAKAGSVALAGGTMSCAVGTPYALAGSNSVIMAAGLTASIFLALTVFTFQSKWDFSFLGAGLFATLWIFMIWGIIMACFGTSPAMQYWYCLLGAVLFSLYIVFDTWMLSKVYGPDDYIAASISLYLDIINLFLMILQLLRRD